MLTVSNKYHGAKGINIMRGSVFGNPYRLQDGYSREESMGEIHRVKSLAYLKRNNYESKEYKYKQAQ